MKSNLVGFYSCYLDLCRIVIRMQRKSLYGLIIICCVEIAIPQTAAGFQRQRLSPLPIKDALAALYFASQVPIDLSPDGEWVAYTLQDNRRQEPIRDFKYRIYTQQGTPLWLVRCDIWVTNIKTGEARNVTNGIGSSWGPVWSPNGQLLAFYSDRTGEQRVWIWEKSSGILRQVGNVIARPYFAGEVIKWTPDGAHILAKVLPEGMNLDQSAELMIVPPPDPNSNQQKELGSTVLIYNSTKGSTINSAQERRARTQRDAYKHIYLSDLVLIDILNGKVKRIASRVYPIGRWISPDGANVAFMEMKGQESDRENQPLYDLVLVSTVDTYKRVLVSNIRQMWGLSVSWSPDGRKLAYTTNGPLASGDCYVVSINGGEPRNLTKTPHPSFGDYYRAPIWDSKGEFVYLLGGKALWKADVTDSNSIEIMAMTDRRPLEVIGPSGGGRFWSPDGQSLVLMTLKDETKQAGLYRVDTVSGKYIKIFEENKAFSQDRIFKMDVSLDGKKVIYVLQDAQHISDIYISNFNFQPPERVTRTNPQLDQYIMGESRIVEWQNADGQVLRGALLLPAGYEEGKHYPMIVYQYPSLHLSSNVNYFGLDMLSCGVENMQMLATRGYAVFLPDVPVRKQSYLPDIAKAVLPGVNKVVELGIADPDRIGVMGLSNGGYGVLCLIVQTGRFRAAISRAGVGNLIGLYSHMEPYGSSNYTGEVEERTGGTLWEKRDQFIENSPVFYLDKVHTPLLIIHGTIDPAAPSFLADEIFVCLRRLGKEATYAKYEGEMHGEIYWSYANQVDYLNRMISWFDKHLKRASEGLDELNSSESSEQTKPETNSRREKGKRR